VLHFCWNWYDNCEVVDIYPTRSNFLSGDNAATIREDLLRNPMEHEEQPLRKETNMVIVTGYKDTGKTTAIEGMVKELSARGYAIGTMKHCHHGYDLDRPGKDSWRHQKAGSAGTALIGPNGFAYVGTGRPTPSPELMANWLFPTADLVIGEGFHWLDCPRIEITDQDGHTRPVSSHREALATLPHRFGEVEVRRVCDLLESGFLVAGEHLQKTLSA
jgi:molybdopterin-guanine dinucleotide biosynthesis protein B